MFTPILFCCLDVCIKVLFRVDFVCIEPMIFGVERKFYMKVLTAIFQKLMNSFVSNEYPVSDSIALL